MILKNLDIIAEEEPKQIRVTGGKIESITTAETLPASHPDELTIRFDEAIAFPGLINSHDHLEFNLFPQLGNAIYPSYLEWGADIHAQNKEIIHTISKIPKHLRASWGMYKNICNGVTTVIHHGEHLKIDDPLINVFQHCYSLHSVGREKYWKLKLNNPFAKDQPFVIHVGEGTGKAAGEEIDRLLKWNLFKRKLIAVHGVAMNAAQARSFDALVWCPGSNYFLLNATAKINELKKETRILFGTDSTVSSGWNLWDQLRLARKSDMLTDKELLDAVTRTPASVWGLDDRGGLTKNMAADIVVAKTKNKTDPLKGFFDLNPEDLLLVMRNGEILVFDEALHPQLNAALSKKAFRTIVIHNSRKYIKGNLAALIKELRQYVPGLHIPVNTE